MTTNIVPPVPQQNRFALTVGIPTYVGGPALVRTVQSIRMSSGVEQFRLLVSVDGNPLKPDIRAHLEGLGVEIIENERRGGQVARIKQMVALADTDILVLTQDDVRFDPLTLGRIRTAFTEDAALTMVGAHVVPEPAQTFLERVIEVGVRTSHRAGMRWKAADNYLLASGRCLAFRTSFVKTFSIPEEIINSDAYLYLKNKKSGGTFRHLEGALIYNRSPLRLREYFKQTKKFSSSREELSKYFAYDVSPEYAIPFSLLAKTFVEELLRHPVWSLLYLGAHAYTKFRGNPYRDATRFWETDVSTKRIA